MNVSNRLLSLGIPAVVGLGVVWIGATLLRSERELEQRRLELEIQLCKDRLKRKQMLLNKSQTRPLES